MFIHEEYKKEKNKGVAKVIIPPASRIARAFGRKSQNYNEHALIQGDLIRSLIAMLKKSGQVNGRWVDCGCGTGLFACECRSAGIRIKIVGIDIAFEPLLSVEKSHLSTMPVQATIDEELPFKNELFDGAVLASTLQWLADPSSALKKIAATLKPEGRLAFSVFTEGAFHELAYVQQRFEIPVPVSCPETGGFIKLLQTGGFHNVNYETREKTIHFPTAASAIKSISVIGGTATAGKPLQRAMLAQFCGAYEERFRTHKGVPLTYRAIIGVGNKRQAT